MPRDFDSDWDFQDSMQPKPERREDEFETDQMYEDFY